MAQQTKNQSELVYRKDKESALRDFTQVADGVSTKQAARQQNLASNLGYQTAPHQQERASGGYNEPPPPAAFQREWYVYSALVAYVIHL